MKTKITEKNATYRVLVFSRNFSSRQDERPESYHMSLLAAHRATYGHSDGCSYPTSSLLSREVEVRDGDGWRKLNEAEMEIIYKNDEA